MIKKKLSWFYKKILFKFKKKINLDNNKIKINNLNYLFEYYGSDKGSKVIDPYTKNSKKKIGHGFGKFYEIHFSKLKKKYINLLEIGTWYGASVAAFNNYFDKIKIFCIDRNFKFKFYSKRIFFYNCDTENKKDLKNFKKFKNKITNEKFDIIIDDGSHLLNDMINNLNFFFPYVKKGGYYVVEDFNHSKYYPYLNDSKGKEILFKEIIKNLKKKKSLNHIF